MGLRIYGYTGVVPRETLSEEELKDTPEECFLELRNPPRYTSRLEPLPEGVYVYTRLACEEHIGSYRLYADWRDWLSRSFIGVPAAEIDADEHRGQPFYELIDFSDSSGFLGPDAVETLSRNFDGWEHELEGHLEKLETDGLYLAYEEIYRQFQRCLLQLREHPGPGSSVLDFS